MPAIAADRFGDLLGHNRGSERPDLTHPDCTQPAKAPVEPSYTLRELLLTAVLAVVVHAALSGLGLVLFAGDTLGTVFVLGALSLSVAGNTIAFLCEPANRASLPRMPRRSAPPA